MRSALFALGLASAAATAQAQTEKNNPPTPPESVAATPNPDAVEGVTVDAPARRRLEADIPADKLAGFDAEAAKDEAFRNYRKSTPPLTADARDVGDPNDQSTNFPGLQTYLPK